jgi:hypothetical protein
VPRKGRLVQPRHIFPWIAAPYIEMLRILWRIERFFFLPIRYLQAWTISAIFGVLGVFFSVALFIPRLTQTEAQASPGTNSRAVLNRHDLPIIREEDQVFPEGYESGPYETSPSELSVRMQRTHIEDFDQFEKITTHSQVLTPKRLSLAQRGAWSQHLFQQAETDELPLPSYVRQARVQTTPVAPLIPEYTYDPGSGDTHRHTEKAPTLLISKSVPQVLSADLPLTYIITVTNNGQEQVESATVEEYVSDIQRVIDCEPRASVSPDYGHLIWDLAQLQPGEERHLSVTIQPDKRRPIAQDTLVSFSSAPIIAETLVREPQRELPALPAAPEPVVPKVIPDTATRPVPRGQPQLVIQFDPPHAVQVGEEVEAYYTVTNVGTADATGIRLLVEVPAQLRHRFGELVEHKISRLTPNESRRALFAALAEGSGRMPLNWTLEANELDNQSDSEWLAVLPEPASAPAKSSIPTPSTLPGKSSIPATEPTPIDEEPQPTPTNDLWNGDHVTLPLAPPGPSSIPRGQRPLPGPSSIPGWADPILGGDTAPDADPTSNEPIDPELMPDEPPLRGHGIQPPDDLLPLEIESPLLESPPPPEGLPTEEPGNVKEQ